MTLRIAVAMLCAGVLAGVADRSAGAEVPLAADGDVRVVVGRGLVSVAAHDATARTIVAEWARLGGVTVVGAEHIPDGPPLSLDIANEPEGRALDILLGGLNYVLTLRSGAFSDGRSIYDRLLIHSRAEMAEIERKRVPLVSIPSPAAEAAAPRPALDSVPVPASEAPATAEPLVAVPSPADAGTTVDRSNERPSLQAIPAPPGGIAAPVDRQPLTSVPLPTTGSTAPTRPRSGA